MSTLSFVTLCFSFISVGIANNTFSSWDGVLGVSQSKSLVQLISGDVDGAIRTQENFSKQAPYMSQITSMIQSAMGNTKAAIETQKQFLKAAMADPIESISGMRDLIGRIRMAYSDTGRFEEFMKKALPNNALNAELGVHEKVQEKMETIVIDEKNGN